MLYKPLTTRCQLHKPTTKSIASARSIGNLSTRSKTIGSQLVTLTQSQNWAFACRSGFKSKSDATTRIFTFQTTWLTNWLIDWPCRQMQQLQQQRRQRQCVCECNRLGIWLVIICYWPQRQQVPCDCFQLWRGSACNIRQKVNCYWAAAAVWAFASVGLLCGLRQQGGWDFHLQTKS